MDGTNSGYKSYEILATRVEGRNSIYAMDEFNENLYSATDNEVKVYGSDAPGIGIKGYSVKLEFPYENWYTPSNGEFFIETDVAGVERSPSETTFPDKYFRVIFFVSLK